LTHSVVLKKATCETNMCKSSSGNRRTFLKKGFSLFNLAALCAIIYPVISFLGFNIPRKPIKIKIDGTPVTGFHISHDFIFFIDPQKFWAISRKCTHLGCRLNINENEQLLVCPCHQSKFSYAGKRLDGPAIKNLATFEVEKLQDGFLVIM
jgi:cytochrome b6-f complex iron-sulfur subunit